MLPYRGPCEATLEGGAGQLDELIRPEEPGPASEEPEAIRLEPN